MSLPILRDIVQEYAVHCEFAYIKGGGFSAGVAGVDNSVAHDGDACAIWVLLSGRNLQTALVKLMPLRRLHGIFLKQMILMVLVPLVHCPVLVCPFPTAWHRRPSSLLYEVSQMGPSLG